MSETSFSKLGIAPELVSSLVELGYETPTEVQAASIPVLMEGRDILAQAPTGTGKTAAFGLPALSSVDIDKREPQVIIVAPTRELTIQVAEEVKKFSRNMKGLRILPIYGGQDYKPQLQGLRDGVHVVVATPGRVIDHLDRGTLKLGAVKFVVLDEADEMLKMGFADDVKKILDYIPHGHQTALFSATMPSAIQQIAKRYLTDAEKIQIKQTEKTVDTIEQFFIRVPGNQKLEVLTRFLEVEEVDAAIVFARTKHSSDELAESLQARGHATAALHGDMNQGQRKKVMDRLKDGSLNIVVATDLAARGIDVQRVSHVFNYDIPYDAECYIHRIGRTGRAGREGRAFLFVTPREQRSLKDIERAVNKPIQQIDAPSPKEMADKRIEQLVKTVTSIIAKSKNLAPYQEMVDTIVEQSESEPKDVAAALAYLMQQANPLSTREIKPVEPEFGRDRRRPSRFDDRGRSSGDRGRGRPGGGNGKRSSEGRSYAGRSNDKRRSGSSEGRSYGRSDDKGRSRSSEGHSSGRVDDNRRSASSEGRSYGRSDDNRRSRPSEGRSFGRSDDNRRSRPSEGRSSGRSDDNRRSRPSEGRSSGRSDDNRRSRPSEGRFSGRSDDNRRSRPSEGRSSGRADDNRRSRPSSEGRSFDKPATKRKPRTSAFNKPAGNSFGSSGGKGKPRTGASSNGRSRRD